MDVIALLARLINCRSVTPDDGGCLDLIGDLLAAGGYSLQWLPAGGVRNLFAARGSAVRLLFAGHVDVVPAGDLSAWRTDPFAATERDGIIFGRGAADMKSGVAAMVCAALAQPRDGVAIFLTSDEEGPATHGTSHFVEWWRAQGRQNIPYCLVGEPSSDALFGDTIKIGRRGSLSGRLRIGGDNPALLLMPILQRLADEWQHNIAALARGDMVTTFQVTELQGGAGADGVYGEPSAPAQASALLKFRYAAPHTAPQLQAQVEQVCEAHAPGAWQCDWRLSATPYCHNADQGDNKMLSALVDAIVAETGQTPAHSTSGGASDGRFLRHICDCVLEFGVPNASIHEANEHVAADDVRKLAAVYGRMILSLAHPIR